MNTGLCRGGHRRSTLLRKQDQAVLFSPLPQPLNAQPLVTSGCNPVAAYKRPNTATRISGPYQWPNQMAAHQWCNNVAELAGYFRLNQVAAYQWLNQMAAQHWWDKVDCIIDSIKWLRISGAMKCLCVSCLKMWLCISGPI